MAVEARTRPTIRRHRTEDHRLPLPTRHKQMEQDRTPALLSHYRQLAWPAAGELPNRRQPYRQHHNLDRPRRRMRARPEHLPDKDQAHQAAEERDTHQTTRVPRGMELYHPTAMRTGCFIPAPNGYPQTITDALLKPTTFVYDVRGNVLKVTDSLNHDTTQNYDVFGRPTDSKVPKDLSAIPPVYITTPAPVYDTNDNVTQATAPTGAVTTAVYDNADQVTSISAPKFTPTGPNRVSSYTYDKVGNLTAQTEPNGTLTTADPTDYVTSYSYDEIYQLGTVTNAAGGKLSYSYDDVGNVVTEVDPNKNATADTTDYTAKYTYDVNHRVKTVTDAEGHAKSSDYDRDGNVVASYDEDNNKTTLTLDARAKLFEAKVPFKNAGGTITYNTTRYSYDQVGNQTKLETPRGVATATANDFTAETTYDQLNRVKEQLSPYDPGDGTN